MDESQRITWFAGLFEGEGSFGFANGKPKYLKIDSTDHDVLVRVQKYFGGSIFEVKKRQPHWKDCWRWTLFGENSVMLAQEMLPFLCNRRSERCKEYIEKFSTLSDRKQRAADLRAEVQRLRSLGMTHRQIGNIVGKDRTYITHILNA